jgi:hypothetical protein
MTPATATATRATATPASTTPAVTPHLPASTARARRRDLAAEMRSQENTSAAQQPMTGAVIVEKPGQGRVPKR